MKPGVNAPVRPRYAGEYHVYQSPNHRDVLLVDRAEIREAYGTLRWAAVLDDDLCKAILAAHNMEWFNGIRHPDIRMSTLRQYAANLTGRAAERDGMSLMELARTMSVYVLNETSAKAPIPWAIEQGLELPTPYLAQIEKMMAITARSSHNAMTKGQVLGELEIIRYGATNLGMPNTRSPNTLIHDRLTELQEKHPFLQPVDIPTPESEIQQALDPAPEML